MSDTTLAPERLDELRRLWIDSPQGRLMVGAEIPEWLDALAPVIAGWLEDDARAAYENGESYIQAEWVIALDDVLPEDVLVQPSVIADRLRRLQDRPDGMPPGVEAASLAAAQAAVPNWAELRTGDQRAIQNQMLPLVVAACRAQIEEVRGG